MVTYMEPQTAPSDMSIKCARGTLHKPNFMVNQDTSTSTQATNQFRTSSSTPPTSGINRTWWILPVIQGTFAAIEQAKNYLALQPFFINTHFGQTLINCIHNQHRRGIPDKYFVETCINTYTQNGFVTKEFVKIDETSQTQDYTIVYI